MEQKCKDRSFLLKGNFQRAITLNKYTSYCFIEQKYTYNLYNDFFIKRQNHKTLWLVNLSTHLQCCNTVYEIHAQNKLACI